MTVSFDLIGEPFIPCVRTDGTAVEYGLRDALLRAHEIRELRDLSPLVTIALHRLLLAVLHRAYGGPRLGEREAILRAGRFDAGRVTAYLAKWADRFDLFHEKYPFYQRAGFTTKEPSGINRLAQELSRGNNAALFDHTYDDPPPAMTPAETARLVAAEQAFAVGGGKSDTGNTTHAPLVSAANVLVRGATLFETLWLNLTVYDDERPVASDASDLPVWERKPAPPHTEPPTPFGYMDYLTWQSRTLRVVPEEAEGGAVVVRRVHYGQGRKCEVIEGFFNPMVAYTRADKKDPWMPVRFNEFRDLWRDSAPLFQLCEPHNELERAPRLVHDLAGSELRTVLPAPARYQLSVFGLCTDKAKVNFWRHESLPLPLKYLNDAELIGRLKLALKLAEEVGADALRKAAWVTAAARLTGTPGMSPDTDRVRDLVDSFATERLYWSRLELHYRALLVALAEADAAGRSALVIDWYHNTLYRTALHAFDESIGRIDAGRDLKAVTAGGGALRRLLKRVQRTNTIPDREQKEGAA
ncbi:MAG: type I-E CRISPR-associated protein Cse1/CasA [Planctomycetes bacterium]|nr:type I-E CRISPR-associated protein Cse1/CasA [Planctomycetota bacterium]